MVIPHEEFYFSIRVIVLVYAVCTCSSHLFVQMCAFALANTRVWEVFTAHILPYYVNAAGIDISRLLLFVL